VSVVGVVLSGCGVYDGSEIHEAVLTLYFLRKAGVDVLFMAPKREQLHVINHLTGEELEGERRDVLVESARIARGEIQDVGEVHEDQIDALIFPGGFGAAKNLCNFAVEGESCTVDGEVERLVREMRRAEKPIGSICIAPALLARILGEKDGASVTVGTDKEVAEKIEIMGSTHVSCRVDDFVVDEKKKIVTTPAYMLADDITETAAGIEKLVSQIISMIAD
jgi:enhancing lycopene biosynthesis protein 2